MSHLYRKEKLTDHVIAYSVYTYKYYFFAFIILYVIGLFIGDFEMNFKSIAIITSLLIISIGIHFFFNPIDIFSITQDQIKINKFSKKEKIINHSDIQSFQSGTMLKLMLNSKEEIKISYSNWQFSKQEVNEITSILDN